MIHQRLLLALIYLIQKILPALAQIVCDQANGNYTAADAYGDNLSATLSALSTNIDANGFYNASIGQGSDRVNAVALCRGDLQVNACRDCVRTAAAALVQTCPNQKQAIMWNGMWNETCMVRYSNATIYGVMSYYPGKYWWNPYNSTSPEQFKADLRVLMDGLRKKAAAGSRLRKVAAGNATGPDFQTIFALLQCTPDLSSDDCSACLIGVISYIPQCCGGRVGGSVLRPSCILRFKISPFFNETRLQEMEQPPPPQLLLPPLPLPAPRPPQLSPGKDGGQTTRTVIIIVAAVGVCLMVAVSVIIFLRRRKKHKSTKNPETDDDADEISIAESLQYAFSTIKTATNDFSKENKLGQGGFGSVYKGKLENGQEIAVKRLSMNSGQGDMEFKNEVMLLAKLQHRNLVRLLGFAIQGMEKLLIYELVQNASLDHFIFDRGNRSYLDWDRRYKIIGGIARGILYLHEDSRLRIIHRDLKASNVLLDREMNPKIADFGMARLFAQDESQANTSRIVGTYGYMPPEYVIHGQFSIKSDVFSFGVLVLEIISGRKNNNFRRGEHIENLLSFAWKNWREGTTTNVVDPLLRSGSGSMNETLRCIHIGLLCVQESSGDRPTMASVVIMLSSSTMNLALPSQPAFYYSSIDVSEVERLDNYDLQGSGDQSYHLSHNDVSISELYPR